MNTAEGHKQTSTFVMGTRWDKAPSPLREINYTYICGLCKETTYTETEYSQELTVICNVCAAGISSQVESYEYTEVIWDIPPDLLKRLFAEAQARNMPPEDYVIGFLEWKTGQELPQIRIFNRDDTKETANRVPRHRRWIQKALYLQSCSAFVHLVTARL